MSGGYGDGSQINKVRSRKWTGWRIARVSVFWAFCLLWVIVGKGFGVLIDVLAMLVYGGAIAGLRIFKGGTRYIARTNAEEMAKKAAPPQL